MKSITLKLLSAFAQVAATAALLGMFSCSGNISQGTAADEYFTEGTVKGPLAGALDTYMSRITPFGFAGALLVAQNNQVILNQAYGLAVRSESIPNTVKTAFSIGSITKSLTATAIMTLIESGRLEADDLISKFLPDVPPDKAAITVHHLLTHTSGLNQDVGHDYDIAPRDETVKKILAVKLAFEPGGPYRYTNTGFTLLAAIIEHVSGKSYEDYLREAVLTPAGMTATGYRGPDWSTRTVAHWYRGNQDNGRPIDKAYPQWNLMGNGGILTITNDMYRLTRALKNNTLMSQANRETMFAPHVEGYGYGWESLQTPHGKLVQHNGGSTLGNSAELIWYMEEDLVVVLFANQNDGSGATTSKIRRHILDIIRGKHVAIPPEVMARDERQTSKLPGVYSLAGGGKLKIGHTGMGLKIQAEGQAALSALFMPGADIDAETLNHRSVTIFEQAIKGEMDTLAKYMDDAPRRQRIVDFIQMRMDRYKPRVGNILKVEAVGTFPSHFGGSGSYGSRIALVGERGNIDFDLIWNDGKIHGLAPIEAGQVPAMVLKSVARDEYAGYDLASASLTTFSVSTDGQSGLLMLIFPGGIQAIRVGD